MHNQLRDMDQNVLLKEDLKYHPIYLEEIDEGYENNSDAYFEFKVITCF